MNSLLGDLAKFIARHQLLPTKLITHRNTSSIIAHNNTNILILTKDGSKHKTLIRIFYERKNKNKTNKKTHISCIPFGNKQSTNKR